MEKDLKLTFEIEKFTHNYIDGKILKTISDKELKMKYGVTYKPFLIKILKRVQEIVQKEEKGEKLDKI